MRVLIVPPMTLREAAIAATVLVLCVGCSRTVSPDDAAAVVDGIDSGLPDVVDAADGPADVASDRTNDAIDVQPDVLSDVHCAGATEMPCSGVCRDLATDPANCGSCGHVCSFSCTAGTCDDAVEIAAGYGHTCARRASGTVVCWGDNAAGEIGDGSNSRRLTPAIVTGLSDAVEVTAGHSYACARRTSGSVVCWGDDNYAELGDGSTVGTRLTPVPVVGLSDAVQIAAASGFTCARRISGTVACWGDNNDGSLGDGSSGTTRPTPVAVIGLTDAVEIALGLGHGCARRPSGSVVCWGFNDNGQVGNGTYGVPQLAPVAVVGLTDAVEIGAGGHHTCARRASGAVACWGSNVSGELGGTAGITSTTLVLVAGLNDAVEIAVGYHFTCARRRSGAAVCWGENLFGQVGDGSAFGTRPQSAVSGLSDAVAIAAGDIHACAIRASGAVLCWGHNPNGEIGDGTMGTDRRTPVAVLTF